MYAPSTAIEFETELEAALDDELGDFFEVWFPGEVKAYVAIVSGHINSLDYDIAESIECFKGSDLKLWETFKLLWAEFVSSVGWTTSKRAVERFALELRTFRELYKKRCEKDPSTPDAPTPSEKQKEEYSGAFTGLKGLGGTITTVAIVGIAGYVLIKWAGKKWR